MKVLSQSAEKRKQKGLRVLNFTFSLAVFQRHHGSERVNTPSFLMNYIVTPTGSERVNTPSFLMNYTVTLTGSERVNTPSFLMNYKG